MSEGKLVLSARSADVLRRLIACKTWQEACRVSREVEALPEHWIEFRLRPLEDGGVQVSISDRAAQALEGPALPEERAVAAAAPVPRCPPGAYRG